MEREAKYMSELAAEMVKTNNRPFTASPSLGMPELLAAMTKGDASKES
jgi:hypothetical protein